MDRAAVFVDGGYIEKLLKKGFGMPQIDYGKLAMEIVQHGATPGEVSLLRTYYYDCPPYQGSPPTADESRRLAGKQSFFAKLGRLPRFEVRLGKLAYRGHNSTGQPIFVQKGVDIMLGVDMVQLAATRQIQRAVLLAGDSDFVPALQAVKQHGVLVVLWHGPKGGPNGTVHQELWDEADERFEIDQPLITSVLR